MCAGSKVKSKSLRDDEAPKPPVESAQSWPNVMRLKSWAKSGVSVMVVPWLLSAMADVPKWGCGHKSGGDKKSGLDEKWPSEDVVVERSCW